MPPFNLARRSAQPKPPTENRLGDWQDGQFKFAWPEAERQWTIEAYRSGVSAKDWHRGTPIDDKTRDLVLNNLGGPTPPYFRGPDGQYRFGNIHTIEPKEVRDHRLQALRRVKHADLTGPEMPGEKELAAPFSNVANDNAQPPASPVRETPAPAKADPENSGAKKPIGIGRFAQMAEAQKKAGQLSPEEVVQRIDDSVRLIANGATLGYADNISAAGDAAIMKLQGEDFGANYDKFLASQQGLTKKAEERLGVAGAVIGALPQVAPGAGDALGLGGDIKMYISDPSKLTLGNTGMTALGLLPFFPSVAGTISRIDDAVETAAKVEAKAADKIGEIGKTPAVSPEVTQILDPHQTRFSQQTVSYEKKNRAGGESYTYDDILNSMRQNGWNGKPIDVVQMQDGKLTSADNTRLLASRNAGIPIQARVRAFDAPVNASDARRFRSPDGLVPKTWGDAIAVRINRQKADFRTKNPHGSIENPTITGHPVDIKDTQK